MRLELDVTVSPELDRLGSTGAQVVADELLAATEEGLALIERSVKENTPVGVAGSLRAGTTTDIRGSRLDVLGRVYNPLGYAVAVEEGSRPHRANLAALTQWVKRKLGGDAGDAYRIFLSIAKRGTRPHAFFAPGLAAVVDQVQERYAQVGPRVVARLNGGVA